MIHTSKIAIPGLEWKKSPYGWIRFQGEASFIQAHVSSSYEWVLTLTQEGRVQPR